MEILGPQGRIRDDVPPALQTWGRVPKPRPAQDQLLNVSGFCLRGLAG